MANVSSSNGLEKHPKLRFPGFDEPYRAIKLGQISSLIKRNDPRSNAPIMMLSAGNGFIMQSDKYSRDNAGQSLKKYTLLKKGELAYNHGASKVKQFGCCYELREEEARIPYVYHCFKVQGTEYTPYVALELNNTKMDKQLKRLVSSSVRMDGLLNISYDEYMSVVVYLPAYAEQKHIADFLEKLDMRIAKQEQLIESLKKYKRGVVSKVFSEIARKCNTIRLGDCVTISRGGSPRPIDSYITNDPDGINWIKIGDTSADELYITRTKEKIIPSGVKKSRKVFQGDLILSNSMSFGRPYILQIDGCIHDGWLLIRDESNVFEKRFLCYYLGSDNVFTQYKRFAAGSCVNNLNSELVGDVEICCPPRSIQQKVADMLAVLDSRIAHSSRIYEALQQMRTSLLQQLFI